MRAAGIAGTAVLIALAACTASPAPAVSPPAQPVEAAIVGRYTLTSQGATVGTITSIVRCGDTLYLGDVASRIHRLNIATGRVEPPIDDSSLLPMALAADCDRGRVWAISPKHRGRGLRAVAFDISSGSPVRELDIPGTCFVTSSTVSRDLLFIGGECIDGPVGDNYVVPPAASYYADKRIGIQVSLTSGRTQSGLMPFEKACDGGGACVGGTVAALGGEWIASLPLSSQLGIYSLDGKLRRTVAVGSSRASARDGSRLPRMASSEQRVNWSTRNTLIDDALVVANHLVVVHYVLDVPPGWRMDGATRPQFKASINVLAANGTPRHVDLALPELPVGHDHEALYVIDYGPQGRQGAHEAVTVLRVAVPVS